MRTADFWDEGDVSYIHINYDNWSDSGVSWIQLGTGTKGDPHRIENVTINGGGIRRCIFINNSRDYFVINNCTVYNAVFGSTPHFGAGIVCENTTNGLITECDSSYHGSTGAKGFFLLNCSNINITYCTAVDNVNTIRIDESYNCVISHNWI